MTDTVLDNPAWEALNSQHAVFATGTDKAKRYRPGILPFTGCLGVSGGSMEDLDPFLNSGEALYIIGDDLPRMPATWVVEHELPCAQMLLTKDVIVQQQTSDVLITVEELGADSSGEMFDLINKVQPGYYQPDTYLLGTYFGIREEGRLVAMAGERMRLNGFSELSAICTLPSHTGRGYAQILIAEICRLHAANNVVSFLHVTLANQRAIRLYEFMGFQQRRTIIFRRFRKP